MPDRSRPNSTLARSLRDRILPLISSVVRPKSMLERMLVRVLSHLHYGRLALVLPDGRTLNFTGRERLDLHAVLDVRHWRAIRKLATGGDLAFAEAYIDGDWRSPDLTRLMQLAILNEPIVQARFAAGLISRLVHRLAHLRNANTIEGSRRNISYHYDLGNEFYRLWLDPGMTYSSALYRHDDQPLADAQTAKYTRICELAALTPGEKVLEVGCGWGGFAEMAAQNYGCDVEGLTLSQEQLSYAEMRLKTAGLAGKTNMVLRDYRHQEGQYDKLVSIEMFEAVGEEHWPTYFDMIRNRLRPGGKAVLQIITIDESRFEGYREGADFIQRYIFPGGMLPSPTALKEAVFAAGLKVQHSEFFGQSYARTLAEWQRDFQHNWEAIAKQGFDLRFKRMWEYYLSYCQTGFEAGTIDVGLFVITHDDQNDRGLPAGTGHGINASR
ncbi:class I SAM-dependent methyltransferase [Thalassospira sp.]|uniref:class I SAM-dependent methyltransferase n=1 Tax=Thalassospira sp. TaxID=1912094 RepID=UPI003AA9C5B0